MIHNCAQTQPELGNFRSQVLDQLANLRAVWLEDHQYNAASDPSPELTERLLAELGEAAAPGEWLAPRVNGRVTVHRLGTVDLLADGTYLCRCAQGPSRLADVEVADAAAALTRLRKHGPRPLGWEYDILDGCVY